AVLIFGTLFSAFIRVAFGHEALSFCGFAIATYGLLGLFLSPQDWRQGIPAALLVGGLLPVSFQFGSGMGFSLRVLTAGVVEQVLAIAGVAAISAHDVIVLENSIAHVDLPCSGLKSVAVGLLFLSGCSWLEGRKVGWRWLGVAVCCVTSLIIANVCRVLALVAVGEVSQQHALADTMHVPLGVIGFAIACGLTWFLLQTVPQHTSDESQNFSGKPFSGRPMSAIARWTLIAGMVAVSLVPAVSVANTTVAEIAWPEAFHLETLEPTPAERRFFERDPLASSHKYRFEWGEDGDRSLTGSLLLVASPSWRSHHAPELCYVGNGFRVDRMRSVTIPTESAPIASLNLSRTGADPFPARWISLENDSLSAIYWFQSETATTDNLLDRIWAAIAHRDRAWVMVSVLFERSRQPDEAIVQQFARQTRIAIARSFHGETRS
ncbi:MAG: exosortase O, partial [Cyanobacteria bacterium J06648_11]